MRSKVHQVLMLLSWFEFLQRTARQPNRLNAKLGIQQGDQIGRFFTIWALLRALGMNLFQ